MIENLENRLLNTYNDSLSKQGLMVRVLPNDSEN